MDRKGEYDEGAFIGMCSRESIEEDHFEMAFGPSLSQFTSLVNPVLVAK